MIHARKDYNRIQDPASQDASLLSFGSTAIAEDEPVFLLRAQDAMAYKAVLHYAKMLHAEAHLRKDEKLEQMADLVDEHAHKMAIWHPKKMPDVPNGVL